MDLNQAKLDKIVEKTVAKKYIHGAVFHVASRDHSIDLISASGNILPDGLYYIASINKLFIAAITLRLVRENRISLSDQIAKYLPAEMMQELLVYQGKDYSGDIIVGQLLSHTSGLPCYLIDKRPEGPKVMEELLQGMDQAWSTEQVVAAVKKMKPKFWPGQKGKASYSDTNFRLMGRILEAVTEEPLDVILINLFHELNLHYTFVLGYNGEKVFVPIYVKENPVRIPRYLASTRHDIISNALDQMVFLKTFIDGYFYPKDKLQALVQWNRIFFPFKYSMGMQQFYIPRILSPFKAVPKMIGHSGSVGSVAFYVPEREIFITGTVNQANSPNIAFQTMIKIINQL